MLLRSQRIALAVLLLAPFALWALLQQFEREDHMITLLAMGQSNAVGRGDGGVTTALPGVTVWNNANDINTLGSLGSAFVTPDINAAPFVGGKNNMFLHMANNLKRYTGQDVRLILVAMGAQEISAWAGATGTEGPMYDRMQAVLAASGITDPVDIFAWHQGENDNPSGSGTYATKFGHLLSNLQSDGIITASTPVVIGELVPQYTNMNPVLHSIAANAARIEIARITALSNFDNVHFTGAAMPEAGLRYVQALSRIPSTPYFGIVNAKNLTNVGFVVRDTANNVKLLGSEDVLDSRRKTAFSVRLAANVPLVSATWTKLAYSVIEFNQNSFYDAVTGRFTPPAGRYDIKAGINLSGLTTGGALCGLSIRKNGEYVVRQTFGSGNAGAASAAGWALSCLVECNGADFVEAWVYATGTGSQAAVADFTTYFMGHAI